MERFDETKVVREGFADSLSHLAFLKLGHKVNELIDLHAKGCLILYEGVKFTPEFKFQYGENPSIGYRASLTSTYIWAGCTTVNGKTYLRKKDVNEILEKVVYVMPGNFRKLSK